MRPPARGGGFAFLQVELVRAPALVPSLRCRRQTAKSGEESSEQMNHEVGRAD
jgi:hypothetical protein